MNKYKLVETKVGATHTDVSMIEDINGKWVKAKEAEQEIKELKDLLIMTANYCYKVEVLTPDQIRKIEQALK